jgi:predicted DNA-binding transcriptional regulator YafY
VVWRRDRSAPLPPRVHALAASLGWGDALQSTPAALSMDEGVDVASPEARILKLVSYILAQPGAVTAGQIFERFADDYGKSPEARERKFSRDKAAIKRLGFVLDKDGEDAYLIDPRSSQLPKVELDADEALAVWTAALAAVRHSDHPLREDLESALRKMMSGWKGLPPRAGQPAELAGDGAEPSGAEHLDDLVDAWLRRKRITIEYWHPGRDETETRQVDVYGWARRRGEWIFVGHCHKRDAVRIFYLSRVRKLTTPQGKALPAMTGKGARRGRGDDRDEYDIPKDFDVRRWSRQQPWDYVVHAPKPAAVRFSGSLAKISHQLLPGLRAAVDDQGRRTYRLEVRNLRGLVRQALAWGPEAELIEPPEGRALALEILRETRTLVAGGRP